MALSIVKFCQAEKKKRDEAKEDHLGDLDHMLLCKNFACNVVAVLIQQNGPKLTLTNYNYLPNSTGYQHLISRFSHIHSRIVVVHELADNK